MEHISSGADSQGGDGDEGDQGGDSDADPMKHGEGVVQLEVQTFLFQDVDLELELLDLHLLQEVLGLKRGHAGFVLEVRDGIEELRSTVIP